MPTPQPVAAKCPFHGDFSGTPIAQSAAMSTANAKAWAQFEAMLDAMHAGDLTTVREAVDKTGIGVESAELVLDALVRADLFEQHGDQFVRLNVFRGAELNRQIGR